MVQWSQRPREVSCQVFGFFESLGQAGIIDLDAVLAMSPTGSRILDESASSIPWDEWSMLIDLVFAQVDHDETRLESLAIHMDSQRLTALRFISQTMISVAELYHYTIKYVAPRCFPAIEFDLTQVSENKYRVAMSLPDNVASGRLSFILASGALKILPRLVHQPDSQVTPLTLDDRQCEFEVDLPAVTGFISEEQSDSMIQVYSKLNRSATLFEQMLESIPLLAVTHEGGQVELANPHASELLGERTHLADCVADEDRENVLAFLNSSHGRPTELRLCVSSGYINVLATNVFDADLEGAGVSLFVAQDITDRLQLQSRVAASERMASLGTLAAGVAHEINNPMTSVIANLELAFMQLDSPESTLESCRDALTEALNDALTGANRVSAIVGEMNAFSRDRDFSLQAVDLKQVIEASIRLAMPEFRHGVVLELDLASVGQVVAAAQQLSQVFVNLLNNAAFACDSNGTVTVRAFEDGGNVIAEVIDTGSGMPNWLTQRIFEPFFTTKTAEGTGLGLTISKSLLDEMGGSIEVRSEVGKGTTFRVTLPLAESFWDLPATPVVFPPGRLRNKRAEIVQGLDILLIDDEEILHRTLTRYLEPSNRVLSATSGVDALATLNAHTPDVILCDLMMPGMTGIEVYHEIQLLYPDLLERLLFVTGGSTTIEFEQFVDEHRDRTLLKPFTMKALNRRLILMAESQA